jgi:predicted nucleic acid-binding protein
MGCLVGFVEMYRTTAYDAGYVALRDSPLITRDRRLATAGSHYARIELA